jgi:hypothetical protein
MRTLLSNTWLAAPLGLLLLATPATAQSPNACGCYADAQGACHCSRPSKCGCPDECEPMGCEKKRLTEANREAEKEMKRISAREKERSAKAAKEMKEKRAKQAAEKREARLKERKAKATARDEVDQMLK